MEVPFPLIAFTADTVSRVTGLSIAQLHRWDRTGFFAPAFADPQRRRPHSRVYSSTDIVGLKTIVKLRRLGVSWSALKKVRALFSHESNEDWVNRRFYVVGKRLFFTREDAILATKPLEKQVDLVALPVDDIARSVRQAINQLGRRTDDEIGKIVTDRFVMGGAPIIAGTRIPTATIAWFARNGYDTELIQHEFPRLEADDIDVALSYEGVEIKARQRSVAAVG